MKSFFITNVGCTRRKLDCERMKNFFIANGMRMAESPEGADYIFISTCGLSVYHEDESIKRILRLKDMNGETIVYGCLPSMNTEKLASVFNGKTINTRDIDSIDKLFHAFKIKFKDIPDANKEYEEAHLLKNSGLKHRLKRKIKELDLRYLCIFFNIFILFLEKCRIAINRLIPSILSAPLVLNPPVFFIDPKNNFMLRILTGCMGNCSYCNIKKAIGRLRSKPIPIIIEEVKNGLSKKHYKYNIISSDSGSYGTDIDTNLPELIRAILDEDKKIIIEFIQDLHPKWICRYKSELIKLIATKRMKSILTPIQSGNDRILKLMNRNTDIIEFKGVIKEMRRAYPRLRLRTQVIVGFPTETEQDFQDTINVVKECGFDEVDIFQYVERDNMASVKIIPKVPHEVIYDRIRRIKLCLPIRTVTHAIGDDWSQYESFNKIFQDPPLD
jgi:tRNA A37 methylthiotransferase MiaB